MPYVRGSDIKEGTVIGFNRTDLRLMRPCLLGKPETWAVVIDEPAIYEPREQLPCNIWLHCQFLDGSTIYTKIREDDLVSSLDGVPHTHQGNPRVSLSSRPVDSAYTRGYPDFTSWM